LLETLKVEEGMPNQVDLLLLDSKSFFIENVRLLINVVWTPLALPTLKLVKPRLRPGAIVIADNVEAVKPLYKEFLA
jgi:hypothetical protein